MFRGMNILGGVLAVGGTLCLGVFFGGGRSGGKQWRKDKHRNSPDMLSQPPGSSAFVCL